MRTVILIALGGSVGAVGRWAVSGLVHRLTGAGFPWGTLTVNLLGSLLLGLTMALSLESDVVPPGARLALGAGFLGAFTTFSTFSYETMRLLEDGDATRALGNVLGSVVLGLLACWAGLRLARLWIQGG